MARTRLRRGIERAVVQRRPRLGILVAWFVGFWIAGVRPSLAAVLGAWSVVAALHLLRRVVQA